tara:strand:- start:7289 stop:7570 length:282 start_codon:yes stop_codon:yes gene_type:complete
LFTAIGKETPQTITESDPGGPNNVILASYNSLADLKKLTAAGAGTSLPSPSAAVSISALVFVPDPLGQIPEPATFWLLALGLLLFTWSKNAGG